MVVRTWLLALRTVWHMGQGVCGFLKRTNLQCAVSQSILPKRVNFYFKHVKGTPNHDWAVTSCFPSYLQDVVGPLVRNSGFPWVFRSEPWLTVLTTQVRPSAAPCHTHPFKSTQWAFCWWPAEPSRKGRVKTPLLGEAAACCVVLLQSVVWQGVPPSGDYQLGSVSGGGGVGKSQHCLIGPQK